MLQHLGFKALASTSAGMAWAMGRADGAVSLDEVLLHLSSLAHATDLPLNADFENAFADAPERGGRATWRWRSTPASPASRSRTTRAAAPRALRFRPGGRARRRRPRRRSTAPSGVLLTARSEGFLRGAPDMDETIRRLNAFAEAGRRLPLRAGPARRGADPRGGRGRGAEAGEHPLARPAGGDAGRTGRAARSAWAARLASMAYGAACAAAAEIADARDLQRRSPRPPRSRRSTRSSRRRRSGPAALGRAPALRSGVAFIGGWLAVDDVGQLQLSRTRSEMFRRE